jgi:hypothetical protein
LNSSFSKAGLYRKKPWPEFMSEVFTPPKPAILANAGWFKDVNDWPD